MTPKSGRYAPVDCTFHDRLESLATLGRTCRIHFRDRDGESTEVVDRIVDVFARNRQEFVALSSGIEVRLDRLESVDGHRNPEDPS